MSSRQGLKKQEDSEAFDPTKVKVIFDKEVKESNYAIMKVTADEQSEKQIVCQCLERVIINKMLKYRTEFKVLKVKIIKKYDKINYKS